MNAPFIIPNRSPRFLKSLSIAVRMVLVVLCGTALSVRLSAQPTGRIINIYTPVVTIDSCFITVESSSGFSVGDRVLIIQMQGATANSSNTDAFGSTTDLHDVGNFEFGTIRHINGNDISLVKKLARTYDPASRVQMVRVPRYKDLTIGDLVTAQPWDGRVGGVVALEATGTVTITASGSIDVSETGFRGGKALDVNRGCGGMVDFFYPASDDRGARKGEGIAIPQSAMQNGKGAWTNGGGGGNNHNAGGGGGALVGSGGFGGCEWSGCSTENLATRGIGGYGLSYSQTPARAFMGGGGGAGHTNNRTGTSGGNGGGIIILRAGALTGSGKLLSNGQTVPLTVGDGQDGCGGGGSAGSIFLDVATPGGSLTVSLKGGDGGSTTFYEKVGPGGGGSGGLLWVSGGTVPSAMQISTRGGVNGTHVRNGNDSWKATPGENGATLTNLRILEGDSTSSTPAKILGNRKVCQGDSITLHATPDGPSYTYRWSTGATTQDITVRAPGKYWVIITDSLGCASTDTVIFAFRPPPHPLLPTPIKLCEGDSATIDAGSGYVHYLWSTGETTRSITVHEEGIYSVAVVDSAGCEGTSSYAEVTVVPRRKPIISPTGPITLCEGDSITLDAGEGFGTYRWSNGATTRSIVVRASNTYRVIVDEASSCRDTSDEIVVTFTPAHKPKISPSGAIVLCKGNTIVLDAGEGFATYKWSTGEVSRTITVSEAGTYRVETIDENGCKAIDQVVVKVVEAFPVKLIPSGPLALCAGDSVTLDIGPGYTSYLWSTGDTTQTITVRSSGSYWVRIVTPGGCTSFSDTVEVTIDSPKEPMISSDRSPEFCAGEAITLDAGPGYASYLWSTGETTQTIMASASGTYTVEVFNDNGCNAVSQPFTVIVHEPRNPEIALDGPSRLCDGQSAVLRATPGLAAYLWSTGETTPSISTQSAGAFWVSTVDEHGCSAVSDTIVLETAPTPKVDAGPDRMICLNESVELDASEDAPVYRWAPDLGLSCSDCRRPIASPSTTTQYIVSVTNEFGCEASDTIIVAVDRSPRHVRLHIPRGLAVYPGIRRTIPVILDDRLDDAAVDTLEFSIEYAKGMLLLQDVTTDGTLTNGWSIDVIEQHAGLYHVRLIAPNGTTLRGTGTLIDLNFGTFIGDVSSSELPFTVDLISAPCTEVVTDPGDIRLDSICGLNFRLIEASAASYALEPNRPNPFNPTTEIPFSIGLDGETRLTIHDASGALVAVLVDRHLEPGHYTVTWDAGNYPSGVYYYRLVSGAWSRTSVMMLVK